MAENYTPDGQHDLIPEEVREKQSLIGPIVLEAYYGQMCTDFRAEVFTLLSRSNALEGGNGWAVFDKNGDSEGSVAIADGSEEVLVSSVVDLNSSREIGGNKLPSIHVVTNELIVALNGNNSYYTTDFTLDPANDAQYCVDGLWIEEEDGKSRASTQHGVIFIYGTDDDRLTIMNRPQHYFSPKLYLVSGQKKLLPFGTYKCLEDKIHALTRTGQILEQLVELTPVKTSHRQ